MKVPFDLAYASHTSASINTGKRNILSDQRSFRVTRPNYETDIESEIKTQSKFSTENLH